MLAIIKNQKIIVIEYFGILILTSAVTPLFIAVIVVGSGAPRPGVILSCTSHVDFSAVYKRKMATITIGVTTVTQKTSWAESPLII